MIWLSGGARTDLFFTDCVMDLKEVVVLNGIDILPHGLHVRCHDLRGPLAEIEDSGDTFVDKDRLTIALGRRSTTNALFTILVRGGEQRPSRG